MESLIIILIGFPFISALLLGIIKNDIFRQIITYISATSIIISAILFTIKYFTAQQSQMFFFSHTEGTDYCMVAIELFLTALVTVLSIKYKKYYVALLSIVQTALTLWYEFSGVAPHQQIRKIYVDHLTVIMVLIIAVVGTLITVYACGYMKDYHNHHIEFKDRRSLFFSLIYIFLGAMFGLVFSNSLLWIYFFWEITSVISFLLIGYTKTPEAIRNCFRALWMNLLGGLGFAVAIVYAGITFKIIDLQSQ